MTPDQVRLAKQVLGELNSIADALGILDPARQPNTAFACGRLSLVLAGLNKAIDDYEAVNGRTPDGPIAASS